MINISRRPGVTSIIDVSPMTPPPPLLVNSTLCEACVCSPCLPSPPLTIPLLPSLSAFSR